jgi:putative oxidoreductase
MKSSSSLHWISNLYALFRSAANSLQSPLLLAVRLYWGWQFAQNGWIKLHHLSRITEYFVSLGVPFPAFTTPFVSGVEFLGGLLLILGLGARPVALVLAIDMFVAYWTADRTALLSILRDPGTFYTADPYTFLFASLLVLIFGAGFFSLDRWVGHTIQ